LKPEIIYCLISQKTYYLYICITRTSQLRLYWVVNDVYYENFTKVVITLCEHNGVCLNIHTVSLSFLRACFPRSSLAPTHAHLLKHCTEHI